MQIGQYVAENWNTRAAKHQLYYLLLLKPQKLSCQIINHADFGQKRENLVTQNYQSLR